MTLKPTKLTPVRGCKSWVVIIRCISCRGQDQKDALAELNRRQLWLTEDQQIEAGLLAHDRMR